MTITAQQEVEIAAATSRARARATVKELGLECKLENTAVKILTVSKELLATLRNQEASMDDCTVVRLRLDTLLRKAQLIRNKLAQLGFRDYPNSSRVILQANALLAR